MKKAVLTAAAMAIAIAMILRAYSQSTQPQTTNASAADFA
jgi:hypothetical protein